jgi:hypothetical protein
MEEASLEQELDVIDGVTEQVFARPSETLNQRRTLIQLNNRKTEDFIPKARAVNHHISNGFDVMATVQKFEQVFLSSSQEYPVKALTKLLQRFIPNQERYRSNEPLPPRELSVSAKTVLLPKLTGTRHRS